MELLTFTLNGYKRFKNQTSLQTNGKLVALLGPNEAGKSSLLNAIAHIAHSDTFAIDEVSRDTDAEQARLVARFFLNQVELDAAGLSGPRTMVVTKKADGRRTFGFEPAAPARDTTHRTILVHSLRQVIVSSLAAAEIEEQDAELPADVGALAQDLDDAGETVDAAVLKSMKDLLRRYEDAAADSSRSNVKSLVAAWRRAIDLESEPTPLDRAFAALKNSLPTFLFFDEAARSLASSYTLSELRSAVPTALTNLAEVAELNFSDLFAAIDNGQTARVTTIEKRVSRTLGQKFAEAWRQSGIEVALRIQGDLLEIQIVNDGIEHTALAERSDGLRQFVALQMFASRNHANDPVLLIDEADQRLHYDAQADLVQMLARQRLASKVIYTTHSAGCLPEDLGNGVRTVVPQNDDASSVIVNRFWSGRERGLAPLLFGMGASTMAFFPTRRAVLVEGPTDMLLYPTLFREALSRTNLGFQFVPGLSQVGEDRMLARVPSVVHLVDGDAGGCSIQDRLLASGVPAESIFVMRNKAGTALELEDFIAEAHLLAAANLILDRWHPGTGRFEKLAGDGATRMQKLETAFLSKTGTALPKVDLAYNLLDMLAAAPDCRLLDPRRAEALGSVATAIATRLERL